MEDHLSYTASELEEMLDSGMAFADCEEGCVVEPDGECPHGHPSVLILLGLI
jgi:hypothetical protein